MTEGFVNLGGNGPTAGVWVTLFLAGATGPDHCSVINGALMQGVQSGWLTRHSIDNNRLFALCALLLPQSLNELFNHLINQTIDQPQPLSSACVYIRACAYVCMDTHM